MLENTLADVAGQEQAIRFGRRRRGEEPQPGRRQILRFVDDDVIKWFCRATLKGFRQAEKDVRPSRMASVASAS